jgi:hypothetical protein
MRKLKLLPLFLLLALPLYADRERGQSYFTYDDGGTIVRQGGEGREIEARVNLPLFAGDEVVTSRRGRSEIRLSDGNVVGIDRSTSLRFTSILGSYEGDAAETVAELQYGHVIVMRTSYGRELLRLDTQAASYVASEGAIYAVDTDRGRDRVTVFDGAVEVRTPRRTSRLRAGDSMTVDDSGAYGLVTDSRGSADDFERWFMRRTERYGRSSSRYLDRTLAYSDDELGNYGSWIYVSNFNTWCWRPRVSVGWRPYFHGEWMHGRGGHLIWVSYEPWGWVPYHYGRWGYDSAYGWVWLPGSGYSPAWVYWMYGPSYIGWAPAGWWDCYRPYYEWCYRPYARAGVGAGWNFYGQVRPRDIDMRPWTFTQPNRLVGVRVDTAAITTDAVRQRILRNGDTATVSNTPARFTRSELRDPDAAVNNVIRRGIGGGSGRTAAPPATDMTPFIRRDPALPGTIRDRIVRQPGETTTPSRAGVTPAPGSIAPIGGGSLAPIGGGSVAPIGGGNDRINRGGDAGGVRRNDESTSAPAPWRTPVRRGDEGGAGVDRGTVDRGSRDRVSRDSDESNNSDTTWRDRVRRPATPAPSGNEQPPAATPRGDDQWRGRVSRPAPAPGATGDTPAATPAARDDWRGRVGRDDTPRASEPPPSRGDSDVARRIIDRIGGARIYPSDGNGRSPQRDEGASSPPPRVERSSPPPSRNDDGGNRARSGSSDDGSRSNGRAGFFFTLLISAVLCRLVWILDN